MKEYLKLCQVPRVVAILVSDELCNRKLHLKIIKLEGIKIDQGTGS